MDNQWYIIRCNEAGVFFGHIKERHGSEAMLTDARCLWYWDGAASLMQMAVEGVKYKSKCKFTMTVPEITVLDVIEIIPCSDMAAKCILEVPEWKV